MILLLTSAESRQPADRRSPPRRTKENRRRPTACVLLLVVDGVVLSTYATALGSHPEGPKSRRGDGRTPEGMYAVVARNAHSRFHRALRLLYPNALGRARTEGVDPGGDIMIHGLPESCGWRDPVRLFGDWTEGCIAVGNRAIEEIWNRVADGTRVEIPL